MRGLRVFVVMGALAAGLAIGPATVDAAPARCLGMAATVAGGEGDDVLVGTRGADVIAGLGGNDRISGLGGNDLICGGAGDDLLSGGSGQDYLLGGAGNDRLVGRAGYDRLDGGEASDVCLNGEATRNCEKTGDGPDRGTDARGTRAICKTPASPPFAFGVGVPLDQQDQIRNGTEIGATYVRSELGVDVPSLTVFSHGDLDGIVSAFTRWYCLPPEAAEAVRSRFASSLAAWGGRGAVFVYTGSRTWAESPGLLRLEIVAHEYFHVVQTQLFPQEVGVPPDQVRAAGPAWLVEGSAEYVGFRALGQAGLVDFAVARAEAEQAAGSGSAPLRSMETQLGFAAARLPYAVGFAAVDLLVGASGERSLVAFWDSIGRGARWRAAFETAFARSVDAFYDEFDRRRGARVAALPAAAVTPVRVQAS